MMSRRIRLLLWLSALGVAGCSSQADRGTDSNTHFWVSCDESTDCGTALSCECGRCTALCTNDDSCSGYDAICASGTNACADQRMCVPRDNGIDDELTSTEQSGTDPDDSELSDDEQEPAQPDGSGPDSSSSELSDASVSMGLSDAGPSDSSASMRPPVQGPDATSPSGLDEPVTPESEAPVEPPLDAGADMGDDFDGGGLNACGDPTDAPWPAPDLDTSCETDADCFRGTYTLDCCGSQGVVAYNVSERDALTAYDAQCQAGVTCLCPSATTLDGVQVTKGPTAAACVDGRCQAYCVADGCQFTEDCSASDECLDDGVCGWLNPLSGANICRQADGTCGGC